MTDIQRMQNLSVPERRIHVALDTDTYEEMPVKSPTARAQMTDMMRQLPK